MRRRGEADLAVVLVVQSFTVAVLWQQVVVRGCSSSFLLFISLYFSLSLSLSLIFFHSSFFHFLPCFLFFFLSSLFILFFPLCFPLFLSLLFLSSFPSFFSLFFYVFLSPLIVLSFVPPLFLSSLIVVPLSPPGKGVFIKAGGAGATLALSSHGDEVGWLGRPL